jgi:hypothetical protein
MPSPTESNEIKFLKIYSPEFDTINESIFAIIVVGIVENRYGNSISWALQRAGHSQRILYKKII